MRTRSQIGRGAGVERMFEALEARALLAVINWDGGGDGTLLTDPLNWVGDAVPGSSDDAVINVGGSPTITMDGTTFSVSSLTITESFDLSTGGIEVTGASVFGGVTSWNGGSITGGGSIHIPTGATFNIMTGVSPEVDITNEGTLSWFFGNIGGGLAPYSITNMAAGTMVFAAGNAGILPSLGGGSVSNAGSLSVIAGGMQVALTVPFTNTGTVAVVDGTLALFGGGSLAGTVVVQSGNWLDTQGDFTHGTGTISGAGSVRFLVGTHTLGGTLTLSAATELDDAVFTGSGHLVLDASIAWTSGSMTGSGTTTLNAGKTLTMVEVFTKGLGRAFLNNGTVNHSAGALQFLGGATFTNSASKRYNVSGSAQITSTGSGNIFNNAGQFVKSGSGTTNIQPRFNNSGALNLGGGIVNIDGAGGLNTGTRHIGAGATLNYRVNNSHGAGSTATGSGDLNFDGGTQTISGNWTARTFLKLVSGTLSGGGSLTTEGPLSWISGTMTGGGNLIVGAAGKLAIITSSAHTLSKNVISYGVVHHLDGALTMSGSVITNTASSTLVFLPHITIVSGGGTNRIDNAGLLKKMGSSTVTFDGAGGGIALNNTGMVDVRNGVLNLNGTVSQRSGEALTGGTWQVYPAGQLVIDSASPAIITTLGSGARVNLLGSGQLFVNILALEVNNGTISLDASAQLELTPSGGTFTNNGAIEMGANTVFRVNGALAMGGSSVLDIDIRSQDVFSRVIATGAATVAGALAVDFTNGFGGQVGMLFQFISGSSRTGQFSDWDLPTPSNGTAVLDYLASGVRLAIVP